MRSTLWAFSSLLLASALLNLGLGLQGTLLGVRAVIETFPTTITGAIMSAFFIGFILGSHYCSPIINRVGHIRTFAALASLASATTLCHAVFVSPLSWAVLRALTGFCLVGLYMVTESWLNDRASNANRASVLSVYMVVGLGATAVGQLLLEMAHPSGFELFVVVSVLISISLAPVALTASPGPTFIQTRRMGLRRLYDVAPLGVVGCFGIGLANSSFWGMAPVAGHALGLSTGEIASFMFLTILGGVFLQWPLGRLSDRMDRRIMIAAVSIVVSVSGVAIAAAVTRYPAVAFILAPVFGGTLLSLYALVIAHVNDFVEPQEFVSASGTLFLCFGAGASVGPFVASTVMTAVGAAGLFLFISGIHASTGIFAAFRMLRRTPVPTEDQPNFVVIPRTTPVVHELDPRGDESMNSEPNEQTKPAEETIPAHTKISVAA